MRMPRPPGDPLPRPRPGGILLCCARPASARRSQRLPLGQHLPMARLLPRIAAAVALVALLPAAATSVSAQTAPTGDDTPAAVAPARSLMPGDVVQVRIWREEDLSGQFQVSEDGFVVLPLLGRRRVVGVDPDVLREQLTEEYADYLVNPAVNVTLLRRVVVLGEVRVPGQYTVDATNSVADVLARAQGLTPDGNAEDIVLVRGGERLRRGLSGAESLQEAGVQSGDQIIVGERSWASRNFSSIIGVASIIANVVVIFTR